MTARRILKLLSGLFLVLGLAGLVLQVFEGPDTSYSTPIKLLALGFVGVCVLVCKDRSM